MAQKLFNFCENDLSHANVAKAASTTHQLAVKLKTGFEVIENINGADHYYESGCLITLWRNF